MNVIEVGWSIWDTMVETGGLLISLAVAPLAFVERGAGRIRFQGRRTALRQEYGLTRTAMQLSSKTAGDLAQTYLRRHSQLWQTYNRGKYRNLAEAQIALHLARLAEARLLAEAQSTARGSGLAHTLDDPAQYTTIGAKE